MYQNGIKTTKMDKKKIYRVFVFVLIFCAVNMGLYWLAKSSHNGDYDELTSVQPTPEGIRKMLTSIEDPELGINIVDLGLVRGIEVNPDKKATITVIFTSPVCPLMDSIVSQIVNRVKKINGILDVEVKIDKTVTWQKDMLSGDGKRQLEKLTK